MFFKHSGIGKIIWLVVIISCLALGSYFRWSVVRGRLVTLDETSNLQRTSQADGFREIYIAGNGSSRSVKKVLLENSPPVKQVVYAWMKVSPHGGLIPYLQLLAARRVGFSSVNDLRFMSLIWSVVLCVLLYILAKQLSNSTLAAMIVMSLVSFSPYITVLASEMRHYAPLAVFYVLSSVLLLYAISGRFIRQWVLYCVSLLLLFYCSPLGYLILPAHLAVIYSFRGRSGISFPSLTAIFLAFMLSSPALVALFLAKEGVVARLSWLQGSFFTKLTPDIFLSFFTASGWGASLSVNRVVMAVCYYLTLLSFCWACRSVRRNKKLVLVICCVVSPPLFFLAIDYISGSRSLTMPRYLLLYHIAFILIVGMWIADIVERRYIWGRVVGWAVFFLFMWLMFYHQLALTKGKWRRFNDQEAGDRILQVLHVAQNDGLEVRACLSHRTTWRQRRELMVVSLHAERDFPISVRTPDDSCFQGVIINVGMDLVPSKCILMHDEERLGSINMYRCPGGQVL